MSLGLLGRKVGMTRIFTDDGETVPVTVIDVSDNRVTQLKSVQSDGYSAVQVAFGQKKANRVPKAMAGHFAKAGVQAGSLLGEFPLAEDQLSAMVLGQVVSAEIFSPGQKVDVTGTTQGKGFAGTIARHNFGSQRASHGNSRSHNVPGSIGMAQDPGRVFPGKKMPGHDGDAKRTVQNLEVARVDVARQLLLIKGAIPGSKGGHVVIRPAVRQAGSAAK
jgi:large subunit ribosomal protein L3